MSVRRLGIPEGPVEADKMKMEIERKFLVNKKLWSRLHKPAGEKIIQGYITTDIHKTIRVRIKDTHGFLAIKGITREISREELEFPIPLDIAEKLVDEYAESRIEKIRYTVEHKGKLWEVDEFTGDNEGLLVAEIELDSEDERFDIPEWIDKEISSDHRYFNSLLSLHPFKYWQHN